jgi:protein-disulfide isomerase
MTTSARVSRRAVLGALAAAAGSGALAGCLGGSDTPSGPTPVESLPAPVQGDPDADVTVMAFEDYACPHCRTYTLEVLPEIEAEYVEPGTIRYEHHDFPIPVDDRWSWAAAGAGRAVQDDVGDDAFFQYSRLLFENQSSYSIDLVRRLAEQVGADPDSVERAADQGVYRPVLQADRKKGKNLGLDGTPEVFVNGEKTVDPSFDTVAAAIDAANE